MGIMPSNLPHASFPSGERDPDAHRGMPPVESPRQAARAMVRLALAIVVAGGVAGGVAGYFAGSNASEAPADVVATAPARAVSFNGDSSADLPAVIAATQRSVVAIDVEIVVSTPQGQITEGASGTGIVIRSDGMIATNAHVIQGAGVITVTLADGSRLLATVVGRWDDHDLAVVHVDAANLAVADFHVSSSVRVGESVVAVGHALALGGDPSATHGIVSGLDRAISTQTSECLEHMIQVDAAINSGNSGGPLINMAGQVVGIITANSTSAENIGFAIPAETALPILMGILADES